MMIYTQNYRGVMFNLWLPSNGHCLDVLLTPITSYYPGQKKNRCPRSSDNAGSRRDNVDMIEEESNTAT